MLPNNYQREIQKFFVYPQERASEYLPVSIMGEAGEISNVYSKEIRNQKTYRKMVLDETGDIVFYLGALGMEYGYTLEELVDTALRKNSQGAPMRDLRRAIRRTIAAACALDEVLETNQNKSYIIYHAVPVMQHLIEILNIYSISFDEVLEFNLEKLSKRQETNTIKEHAHD